MDFSEFTPNPNGSRPCSVVADDFGRPFGVDRERELQAQEGRAKAQHSGWQTSEGVKVKRASARFRVNARSTSTDSKSEQDSEVGAPARWRQILSAFRGIRYRLDRSCASTPRFCIQPLTVGLLQRLLREHLPMMLRCTAEVVQSRKELPPGLLRSRNGSGKDGGKGSEWEVTSRRSLSQSNGMRVLVAERRSGWLGGKSSEGLNPVGGCGAK